MFSNDFKLTFLILLMIIYVGISWFGLLEPVPQVYNNNTFIMMGDYSNLNQGMPNPSMNDNVDSSISGSDTSLSGAKTISGADSNLSGAETVSGSDDSLITTDSSDTVVEQSGEVVIIE